MMKLLNLKIARRVTTVIFVILVLAACSGGTVDKFTPPSSAPPATTPPYVPPTTSIGAVVQACIDEPMRGTVYYYCDCGAGHETGCVTGNDSNAGTSAAAPRQTIANAVARFGTLGVNDTVALCKGGAFDSAANFNIGSNRCGAGVACNDLREYTPTTFTGTAKPIINGMVNSTMFNFDKTGGVRLLNIRLQGGPASPSFKGNKAFFFYEGAHDVTMCNVDMDAFEITVYNESNAGNSNNIKLIGNHITNSHTIGYLGGGDNDEVSYNDWGGNGSSNSFDHTLYFGSSGELKNMRVIGNYIHGQYGSTCQGSVIEAHMAVNGLLVKDNIIDIAPSATTGGCWGIEFNNLTGGTAPVYNRNALFSGNTIKNTGNLAFTVTGCPDCVIENNLIIIETQVGWAGIKVATGPIRPGTLDDVNTRNIVRNNTIWYGPNANAGGIGIEVGVEGAGHIITNNTVTYSATTTGAPFNCFKYPLALSSYAFINNNHCESAAAYNWEASRGTLAAWKTAAPGFDTASFTGNPLFKAAGTDFSPASGSPLIGKGDISQGYPSTDITGKTRPSPTYTLPSIGAYEP